MRSAIIALKHARGEQGQHAGLLLQRYLYPNAKGEGGKPEEKRALLDAAMRAAKDAEVQALYRSAFERWTVSLPKVSRSCELETQGRMIVGLGSENVLETGIRLHHTYGMPVIPGSALKGLAAHFCDQVWGERVSKAPSEEALKFRAARKEDRKNNVEAEPQGQYHHLLFGDTDDSGCIVFHDAWFVPDSDEEPLKLDVMTPHHSGWNKVDAPEPPTDFDSPIPIPFLSVTGRFCIAVSWYGPGSDHAKKWTELALSLLCEALFEWGVGGKTTSGYGRLAVAPFVPPQKRTSGTMARVQIVSIRPKGGFGVKDVESGRSPGTLTLGAPPPGTDTNLGSTVDVQVHNDDPKSPQYKWPQPAKK